MLHGKVGARTATVDAPGGGRATAIGKQTLVDRAAPPLDTASRGTAGGGGPLPFLERIQASFGRHDVSGIEAHDGPDARAAAGALGARAYASGNAVAFASTPDLHTAAHEAAHVVQQRDGVQLKGDIDQPGDTYERHADAVADAVVAGRSAEPLLDAFARPDRTATRTPAAVQRKPDPDAAADAAPLAPRMAPPTPGINKTGFIDHGDGANIRTGPAETGGEAMTPAPLAPASRVFVSGTHPEAPQWWYVTAYAGTTMVRGYVQDFRITTELPEPTAELHQVVSGETAESLAAQKFGGAVRDGHDLRYYENVLLFVNQQQGRAGITGSYQQPNVAGGGSNNIQLVADHRIWLVSPAYAKAVEAQVPSGSLTGGAVAGLKRFGGHLEDLLRSVNESPSHLLEVAGEYAQMIAEHAVEIAGVVALFLAAEGISMELALTPTGVTQIAAAVIQLILAFFGAQGLVMATLEAAQHAGNWLNLAWHAEGDDAQIAVASKEFLKMLVALAIAALSYLGMKGNAQNAVDIMTSIKPPPLAPAYAIAGQGSGSAGAATQTGAVIGPSIGAVGVGANLATMNDKGDGSTSEPPKPKEYRLTSADVDATVTKLKNSGQVKGDFARLDKVINDAKLGQEGALGELEALSRWVDEGRTVEIIPEVQNATLPDGRPRSNPDYRVDGTITEIKSRSQELSKRWIKDQISSASDQVERSMLTQPGELGQAELQLRGTDAVAASFDTVEQQVKSAFSADRGTNLSRVTVYKDGVKFGEWVRDVDFTITRVFPQ